MLKISEPKYIMCTRTSLSPEETTANKAALQQLREQMVLPEQASGHFDQYAQQLLIAAPLKRNAETVVTYPVPTNHQFSNLPIPAPHKTVALNDEFAQSKFIWQNGFLLVPNKNGTYEEVATYFINFTKKFQEIDALGSVDKYELIVTTSAESFTYVIERENLYKLENNLAKENSLCFIFHGKDEVFKTYIYEQVKTFSSTQPKDIYKIYHQIGWVVIDGKFNFLHAGHKDCNHEVRNNLKLCPDYRKADEFYNIFCRTAPAEIVLPLLMYALYAYMAGLYENACHDGGCRSILYIAGETGSGKTSLTKVLISWLSIMGFNVDMRFDDTTAIIEEKIANNSDLLTLVDDFYPKPGQSDFQKKADEIARIIGDGRIKDKCGPDRKPLPKRTFRGGIIATGEYFNLCTLSSYLRSLVLNVSKGTINFGYITELQKSPDLVQAFFSSWIDWLERNQDCILRNLPQIQEVNTATVRTNIKLEYERLTISIAALLSVADIFNSFADSVNIAFDSVAAREAILRLGREMKFVAATMAPEQVAIDAITEGIENGGFNIAVSKSAFITSKEADGYNVDDGSYWIITTKVNNLVEGYAARKNYSIKFGSELRKKLVSMGFMQEAEGKRFTQDRQVSPRRPRGYLIILRRYSYEREYN